MVQYSIPPLDLSFAALSDATRRGIIEQLGRADASITSLADKFEMTLTGVKKHVQVLERAGLVVTQKVGRVRTCKLGKCGLKAEAEWIEAHRKLFEARFEALDEIISEMKLEGSDDSAS
jgi:DNA-binding transcriptional ArsR family regulator